jgi:hypothetical protein
MVVVVPLPFEGLEFGIDCYSDNEVGISWQIIETNDILFYGIDRSFDGGKTWVEVSKIRASGNSLNSVNQYQIVIQKDFGSGTIYRWYTENSSGEKSRFNFLQDLDCNMGSTYIIFPNPFDNTIRIQVESKGKLESFYRIQIVNQYGQVIEEKIVESNETKSEFSVHLDDLNFLANGIYVINIANRDRILYRKLILKQN